MNNPNLRKEQIFEGIQLCQNCLENDFRGFINSKNFFKQDPKLLLGIQEIQQELDTIASCPSLYTKTIIAVGGGFSAGKSKFISSFFQEEENKLDIGIKPTTEIPTYVLNKDNLEQSINNNEKLDSDDLTSYVILEKKFKDYENICFIDTPGYDPPQGSNSNNSDTKIAQNCLSNAEILLWFIGLDTNDAISRSDLHFLTTLNLSNKTLYIILNKADLKAPSIVQNVMQEVCQTLELESINFEGISAYSSKKKREINYKKLSLQDFLKQSSITPKTQEKILKKLHEIKAKCRYIILKNLKEQQVVIDKIRTLLLKQEKITNDPYFTTQKFEKLKQCLDLSKYKEDLKTLNNIIDKLESIIANIFSNPFKIEAKEINEEEISLCPYLTKQLEDSSEIEEYDLVIQILESKNLKEAVEFLVDIVANLGEMYYYGNGIAQDYIKAQEYLELAIKRENPQSYNCLGEMYYYGNGVIQDYVKAKKLYKSGIIRGNAKACFNLGLMYEKGDGVTQSYTKAKKFYKIGALRGEQQCILKSRTLCNLLNNIFR